MDAKDVLWVVEQLLIAYANPNATRRIESNVAGYITQKYNLGNDIENMRAVKTDFEWACSFSRQIFCGMGLGAQ